MDLILIRSYTVNAKHIRNWQAPRNKPECFFFQGAGKNLNYTLGVFPCVILSAVQRLQPLVPSYPRIETIFLMSVLNERQLILLPRNTLGL